MGLGGLVFLLFFAVVGYVRTLLLSFLIFLRFSLVLFQLVYELVDSLSCLADILCVDSLFCHVRIFEIAVGLLFL